MAIEDTGLGVEFASGDAFYDHILNDLFLPAVADTVITPNTLLERLPRDRERVEGKNVIFPIHIGRNIGVNSIAAGGDLPDPGQQDYDNYSFPIRHTYGRVKFDGITADASKSQMASWLKVIEAEVKGLGIDMSRYKQRASHLDGTGILAETAAWTGAQTTIALDLPSNWPETSLALCPELSAAKFLKVGMRVAFVAASAGGGTAVGDLGDIVTITAITRTVGSEDITWVGAATPADAGLDWFVVLVSNADAGAVIGDTAYGVDPMGIMGIVDDGNPNGVNLQNIDATTSANEWHRAQVFTAAGDRALTLDLVDEAFTAAMEVGDAAPTCLLTSFGITRRYAALLLADRRYVGTTEYDGGYKALDYNGAPVIADRDCVNNRMYMLHEPDLRVYVMSDPQWMNKDGSIYHRIENKDAYQATLYCRETMGTDVRDKHVLLAAISEVL